MPVRPDYQRTYIYIYIYIYKKIYTYICVYIYIYMLKTLVITILIIIILIIHSNNYIYNTSNNTHNIFDKGLGHQRADVLRRRRLLFGRPILYTTTTQRGWCIEAFVSIPAHLQSQKSLPGGGGV